MDTFGRLLLSLTHDGRIIRKEIAPELDNRLPVNRLLAGIYLSYVDAEMWPFTDTLWDIDQAEKNKVLRYRGEEVIKVSVISGNKKIVLERALKINYTKPTFTVLVNRLTWDAL